MAHLLQHQLLPLRRRLWELRRRKRGWSAMPPSPSPAFSPSFCTKPYSPPASPLSICSKPYPAPTSSLSICSKPYPIPAFAALSFRHKPCLPPAFSLSVCSKPYPTPAFSAVSFRHKPCLPPAFSLSICSKPYPTPAFAALSFRHKPCLPPAFSLSICSKPSPPGEGSVALRSSSNAIPTLSAVIQCKGELVDQLVEALMSFGASAVSIMDGASMEALEKGLSSGPVVWGSQKRQFWDQSKLIALFPPGQDIEQILAFAFASIGLKEMLPYEVQGVKHENWVQQIKDQFQPLKISDNFWIVPRWCSLPDPSATNVILDPGLAFGTGDHPTTQLCLQWLKKVIKGREHVLDYGVGSGILAISALKLGAEHAVGVDIDPMAVTSAKQNATLNGFDSHSLEVFLTDDRMSIIDTKYDVVVANLLLTPLLQLSSAFLSYIKPGGCICLSGILESQVDQVLKLYDLHLDHINVEAQDCWACISGIKHISHS